MPPRTLSALALSALLVVASACGSDTPGGDAGERDGDAATGTAGDATGDATGSPASDTADGGLAFPVEVMADNGEVTIEAQPERIVSLAPSATEMLFAIDAGDQVVAVDDQSNFPTEAPVTDLSGFTPNLEAIAGYDPDLVVVSLDTGDLVSGLEAIDIPVLHLDAATGLDGTYGQLEVLGAATGHVGDAAALVAQLQDDIAALADEVEDRDGPPLTYYHELDDQLFSVTSDTFIGEIYALAGLENIADAADVDGTGYPQLASEFVIAEDPDLIFLADTKCCAQSAETVATRPGWDQLSAVQGGAVHELDDDVASRWGPRVVELLETIVEATADATAAAGAG